MSQNLDSSSRSNASTAISASTRIAFLKPEDRAMHLGNISDELNAIEQQLKTKEDAVDKAKTALAKKIREKFKTRVHHSFSLHCPQRIIRKKNGFKLGRRSKHSSGRNNMQNKQKLATNDGNTGAVDTCERNNDPLGLDSLAEMMDFDKALDFVQGPGELPDLGDLGFDDFGNFVE